MAYCTTNFKTKKELKTAVKEGAKVTVFSPGPWPCESNGTAFLEGPHYPQPHKWYAEVVLKDGIILSVK